MKQHNLTLLMDLVEKGWLKHRSYKDQYHVFCHSQKAEHRGVFPEQLREFRGGVLDKNGWMIAPTPPKFFHPSQHPETKNISPDTPCWAFNKVDGSLLNLWWNKEESRWQWSSKCSFISDYAQAGPQFLDMDLGRHLDAAGNLHDLTCISTSYSFNFELRFEEDDMRRVTDIPNGLYLLSVFYTGEEILNPKVIDDFAQKMGVMTCERKRTTYGEVYSSFPTLTGTEGFVVLFDDGTRVKLKTPWYIVRNSFLDNVQTWEDSVEYVKDLIVNFEYGDMYECIPPEYHSEIVEVENHINSVYHNTIEHIDQLFKELYDEDKKTFVLKLDGMDKDTKALLLAKYTDKDYKQMIWEKI